jgi:hypothetical protein
MALPAAKARILTSALATEIKAAIGAPITFKQLKQNGVCQ